MISSTPLVSSGRVAAISLSVRTSFAEWMLRQRHFDAAGLAVLDRDGVASMPEQLAAQLAVVADGLVERDVHFVPGPVGVVLGAGQRPVDAGRADLEVVGAADQLLAGFLDRVDPVGDAARQRHALLDHQLPGRRILGHDLQRALFALAPTASRARARNRGLAPRARSLRSGARYRPFSLQQPTDWQTGSGPAPGGASTRLCHDNVGMEAQIGARAAVCNSNSDRDQPAQRIRSVLLGDFHNDRLIAYAGPDIVDIKGAPSMSVSF